jgi:hypothetical protein
MKLGFQLLNPNIFDKVAKNVTFGYARGLTKTAQKAQDDVIEGLRDKFTLRGRWFEKNNRFGIKMTPATPKKLDSAVWTRASWLSLHEEGGTKTPTKSQNIVVPTTNVRRNKKYIIPKAQRPRQLKGTFVIKSERQRLFMQRRGKGKRSSVRVMYVLTKNAQIKKRGAFIKTAQKSVDQNRDLIMRKSIDDALRSMR